ncbi:MAG: FAD-binding protein [Clostridia bacterium]|nr:FAD-binding protein [Clostridia bacterium]
MIYDIAILGAGPAGATLARLIHNGWRVIVIDQRNLGETAGFIKEKCCGGLLAPDAQKVLAEQGLGVPGEIMSGPQTFSVKSVDLDNGITRYYQRHYLNIDREKFDRWLVSLVPGAVEKRFGCIFKDFEDCGDHFDIHVHNGLNEGIIKARVLVGADGAGSRIRRKYFPWREGTEYISIQESYETNDVLPHYVSVFDKSTTDFYSWIIQKNNHLLLGSAIPGNEDAVAKFSSLRLRMRELGYISGDPVKRTGTFVIRPRSGKDIFTGSERIALAGEAAGFISPSSAEGISYALRSGAMLAECINKFGTGFSKHYKKRTGVLRVNLAGKNIKAMAMYGRLARKLIMKSGILSMNVNPRRLHE